MTTHCRETATHFQVRDFNASAIAAPKDATPFVFPPGCAPTTPLDLEIGCGVGWHPIRYAKENHDRFLIAIEHTRAKFEKFQSRIEQHPELHNLMPVHADAIRWVTHCLKPASLDRCLILYPNPEPKAPNKRWLRMPFMHRLLETLKPGGELILATNERAYFNEAVAFAREAWGLKAIATHEFTRDSQPPVTPAGVPRTHFEKKYLDRGETCFEARFVRPGARVE